MQIAFFFNRNNNADANSLEKDENKNENETAGFKKERSYPMNAEM